MVFGHYIKTLLSHGLGQNYFNISESIISVNLYDILSLKHTIHRYCSLCAYEGYDLPSSSSRQCQMEQEALSEALAQACFSNSITDQIGQQ